MDYAVVGGDARFAYLTRMLMSAGWDARAVDGDSSEVPGVPCAGADALAGARNVVFQLVSTVKYLMLRKSDAAKLRVTGG